MHAKLYENESGYSLLGMGKSCQKFYFDTTLRIVTLKNGTCTNIFIFQNLVSLLTPRIKKNRTIRILLALPKEIEHVTLFRIREDRSVRELVALRTTKLVIKFHPSHLEGNLITWLYNQKQNA